MHNSAKNKHVIDAVLGYTLCCGDRTILLYIYSRRVVHPVSPYPARNMLIYNSQMFKFPY